MSEHTLFFKTIKATVFGVGFLLLLAGWLALLLSNPIGWGLLIFLGILGVFGAAILATVPYNIVSHFLPTDSNDADIAAEADADAGKGFFEKALYKVGSVIAGVVAGMGALLLIGTPLAAIGFLGGLLSGAVTLTAPIWVPFAAVAAGIGAGIGGIFASAFIYEAQASISRHVGYIEHKVANAVTYVAETLHTVATSLSASLSSTWNSLMSFWNASASTSPAQTSVDANTSSSTLDREAGVIPAVTTAGSEPQPIVSERSAAASEYSFLSSVLGLFSSEPGSAAVSPTPELLELQNVVSESSRPV